MKLTRQTDYALRILMYAALQPQNYLLSIQEVTDVYGMSRNHVMKIVQKLGKEGYLNTIRGKGGGFCIGKKPEEINLKELVVLMEMTITPVECERPICRIFPSCRLKDVLADAMSAFMQVLSNYTLADLVSNRQALSELLVIG